MAEEKKEEHVNHTGIDLLIGFFIFIILAVLWYQNGGPGKIDKRGVFISPPAPVGNGAAYGPGGQTQTAQVQYDYSATTTYAQ